MKQIYLWMLLFVSATSFAQNAIITSYVDATCPNATPRIVEIYVDGTVDFTGWDLNKQSNGNGFNPANDLSALGSVTNSFVYVTNDLAGADREYGITTNIIDGDVTSNGDDAFQLVDNNMAVIDRFGEENVDGSSTPWVHVDTFVYRLDGSTANGGNFDAANWTFGAQNLLDNQGNCDDTDPNNALINIVPLGSFSTTASTTPTINVSGAVNDLDYFENNGPSAEGSFTVSGRNLTADVVITVPSTDFEISDTSGGTFTQSITLQQQGGDVASTTLFVRLSAGLQSAVYTEDISLTSGGATTQTVTVTGEVEPDTPTVFISGGATGMNYNEGTGPSAEDSFAVSGRFLTDATIAVTVTAPFEMSLTTNGSFSTQVDVPVTNGEADFEDVFIRLSAGQSVGVYSATVTITSTGAADDTITVDGEVLPAANCPNVGDLIITEFMADTASPIGDNDGEYFEVYNTTGAPIDMESFIISDDGTNSHTIIGSLIVPANSYIVLGKNGDVSANGNITMDYVYGNAIALSNSEDEIILTCGGTVIDRVDYTIAFPTNSGFSTELAAGILNGTDNDVASNWGESTNNYATNNNGTPGAANSFTLSNYSVNKVSFNIYPNPATGNTINLESSNGEAFNVTVFSTLGQQVLTAKNVSNTLNISSLDAGIYLVKLSQGDLSQTRKLIIK